MPTPVGLGPSQTVRQPSGSDGGVGVVRFYQVKGDTPAAVDAVLPRLLEKAAGGGRRLAVVCGNSARMVRLDESLWGFDAESFLPHGLAEGTFADMQPVVLGCVGDAGCIEACRNRLPVVLAGAEAAVVPLLDAGAELVLLVFESSATVLERARALWRDLKPTGASLEYWEQGDSGWQRKGT